MPGPMPEKTAAVQIEILQRWTAAAPNELQVTSIPSSQITPIHHCPFDTINEVTDYKSLHSPLLISEKAPIIPSD